LDIDIINMRFEYLDTDMVSDIDIINMRFEYSDTDTVSDIEYPDLDTDNSKFF
jgi:hypothetical protein